MNFDDLLTKDKHDLGADVEIKHPTTGEPTGIFIKIAGIGSKCFREAKSKQIANVLEIKSAGGDVDAEVFQAKVLAASTIGWSGVTDNDGVSIDFSYEMCERLYLGSDFVYDQVSEFITSRENFT